MERRSMSGVPRCLRSGICCEVGPGEYSSPKKHSSITYTVSQLLCDCCCAPTTRRLHFFVLLRPSERLPARWQSSTDMWRLFQVGASPRERKFCIGVLTSLSGMLVSILECQRLRWRWPYLGSLSTRHSSSLIKYLLHGRATQMENFSC